MGRVATADQKSVWAAATEIAESGSVPTVQAVRERIGGGSYGTIAPLLKEWKDHREQELRRPVVQLPAEALDVVTEAARMIFATAEQASRERIKAVESQASERVAVAEEEREELFREVARLEKYVAELEELYRTSNETALRAEQDLARSAGLVEGLREALGRADLVAAETEKKLAAQIERNTELDAAYKATSAHNRELAGRLADLESLRKPATAAELSEFAKVTKVKVAKAKKPPAEGQP